MRTDGTRGMSGGGSSRPASERDTLLRTLASLGLDETAAVAFCDAAVVLGAVTQGRRTTDLELGFSGDSVRAADETGGRPRQDAAPGSMEAHLHGADTALTAMEAIAACTMRLEAALVVAAQEQTAAVGSALLIQRDVSDPGELSKTARERWRARAKRRTREEITPAIGWTPGETAHLVGLGNAPLAFSVPVVGQMARGMLPWRLARSLWRACESLEAADASHIATVLCADDPQTCVPERLAPDGSALTSPWDHRAFYAALEREVAKVTGADDADPEDREKDRAIRRAALDQRCVLASVDEDGTGSLTFITSALWVAAIKDRLDGAARAARKNGDARTLAQLECDIGQTLLAHATLGLADLTVPPTPDGAPATAEDLLRAGWTPELVGALSGLPPAVLQVVVPLMALHTPGAADTLPATGRVAVRPDPNAPPPTTEPPPTPAIPAASTIAPIPPPTASTPLTPSTSPVAPMLAVHTGRPGCPACLPGARDIPPRCPLPAPGEESALTPGPEEGREQHPGDRGRRLWVGELLGAFRTFVTPAQVRELVLSPGTTLARLLVDPADGRCVERSINSYQPDAAMRAQLLAADVTCRAPSCRHPGKSCQVDHVQEFGTPGGQTSEANTQLLHTGHHDPKTAKDWDAELAANRDVTWTSLLGRLYRTRAWDYRRYVTLLVDAIDAVRSVPAEDQLDELNRQVYLALTHRDLGERLNVGDDEVDPDIIRFEGWPVIRLTHHDRETGERRPGPSSSAVGTTLARWAAVGPGDGDPAAAAGTQASDQDARTESGARDASTESGAEDASTGAGAQDTSTGAGGEATSTGTPRLDADSPRPRTPWSLIKDEGLPPF